MRKKENGGWERRGMGGKNWQQRGGIKKKTSPVCFFEVTEMLMHMTLLIDAMLQSGEALKASTQLAGHS